MTPEEARLRADARRNRKAVVEAADALFQQRGLAVGMDDIAAAARVGVGTLYRHFPTKEALFSAVVLHQLGQLVDLAHTLTESADPCEAFFTFVATMIEEGSARKDLFEALARAGIDLSAEATDLKEAFLEAIGRLATRAAGAGCIRDDLSTPELLSLLVGTCMAVGELGGDRGTCQRMVAVVSDGLRAHAKGRPGGIGQRPTPEVDDDPVRPDRSAHPIGSPSPHPPTGTDAASRSSSGIAGTPGSGRSRPRADTVASSSSGAISRHRPAEQEPLAAVPLRPLDPLEPPSLLGPLGEGLDPEPPPQAHDGPDKGLRPARLVEAGDQGPVDPQRDDREPPEVGKQGVAGPDVVDRSPRPPR